MQTMILTINKTILWSSSRSRGARASKNMVTNWINLLMILMMNKTILWTPLGEWKPEAAGTKEHFRNLSAHKQGFELQNLDLFKDKYKHGFEL